MKRPARWGVYAVSVLVGSMLAWVTFWSPAASAVVEAQDRVDNASLQQGRLGAMLASAQRYADRGDAGRQELETVRTAVPDDAALAAYVLFVDDIARTSGCVVRGLNPRPPGSTVKAPAGLSGIGIDLSVVGTMDQVQAFLVLASRLPRAMVIDEMQVNQESDRLVELSMVARIFQAA